MRDAKLCWITRPDRDAIERVALHADKGDLDVREEEGQALWAVSDAFDAAPETAERRRCVTHDAEVTPFIEGGGWCWKAACFGNHYEHANCVIRTVYEVPASQPDQTSETTT